MTQLTPDKALCIYVFACKREGGKLLCPQSSYSSSESDSDSRQFIHDYEDSENNDCPDLFGIDLI